MSTEQYVRRLVIWRSSFLILSACTVAMLAAALTQ